MTTAKKIRQRSALMHASLFVLQLMIIGTVWLIADSSLETDQRVALLGALAFMVLLATGAAVKYLFEIYILPLVRMREEVALLAANPGHRMEPYGAREVRNLAGKLNELAAEHQTLREKGEERVATASRALAEEKNRFATLMAELSVGVLVCNLEGRILLFNKHALQLLETRKSGTAGTNTALVGLGRSLFSVIDRGLIVHALEQIQHRLNQKINEENASLQNGRHENTDVSSHFVAALTGGRLVRVGMVPVLDDSVHLNGFLLVLEDITRDVEVDSRRDALLLTLTRDARAALANLRAAVEMLQTFPAMEQDRRERFIEVVEEEALRLAKLIDQAQQEQGAGIERHRELEEMRAIDLLALLRRRIAFSMLEVKLASDDANVGVHEAEAWLEVDAYSLSQALAHWCRRLVDQAQVKEIEMRLERAGGLVKFEFSWGGAEPGADMSHEWEMTPLPAHSGKEGESLAAVLARHGAESVYRFDAAGGRSRYWLLLPVSSAPQRLEIVSGVPERPEFYDFDLFQHAVQDTELDQVPLTQISYTVFDTETTGLRPAAGDEIISIGAVRIVNGRLLQQEYFEALLRPRCSLSEESIKIHGITDAMLENQPRAEEVLPQFERFAEDTVLVAHNAAFDLRFLQMQEERTGVLLRKPVLDTLLLSQVIHPNQSEHSLEAIAARLGVAIVGRHTALGDAIVTAEVFLRMLPLLADLGIRTLEQAREAERQTQYARLRY